MSQLDAKQAGLGAPGLTWEGRTPYAVRFGEPYYRPGAGLAEQRRIFLEGCGLPAAWQDKRRFTVCELGFGTGLNFLATWELWRRSRTGAHVGAALHYIAVEGYPLAPQELARLASWPELPSVQALLQVYPQPQRGFHRLFPQMPGPEVMLTLLCGDAAAMLAQLEATVDAWYLDGFAPEKNPDMWSRPVFAEMARVSARGARLAAGTTADPVRSGLDAAGFTTELIPGAPTALRGHFSGTPPIPTLPPWFVPAAPIASGHAAIIGGGIAGAGIAHALHRRGWRTTIIERNETLAGGASGNPAGIAMPRLTAAAEARDGRFHAAAWRFAQQAWTEHGDPASYFHPCGLLQLATSAAEAERQSAIAAGGVLPETMVRTVDADAASEIAGCALPYGALYFPRGGWLNPRQFCAAAALGAEFIGGKDVTALIPGDNGWKVMSGATEICTADAVVLANATGAAAFPQSRWLPLGARRGQITFAPATSASAALRTVLAYGGYLTPADGGLHCLGATFDWLKDGARGDDVRAIDHARNLDALKRVLPELLGNIDPDSLNGRAAIRCTSPDHLPLAGPLPAAAAYERDYADLHHGRHWQRYPNAAYQRGLYVMTALGAYGLVTGPLAAEVLASQIAGDPWPLERDLVAALHPGRFLIRALRRTK